MQVENACFVLSAYDGPYENSPESPTSPQNNVTKIHVLNVTPDSTKTEETDSDNDIPTIPTGNDTIFIQVIVTVINLWLVSICK